MDAAVHALPGLAGLELFERARRAAGARQDLDQATVGRRRRTRSPSRGSGGIVFQR
jgi:hypothetical protein